MFQMAIQGMKAGTIIFWAAFVLSLFSLLPQDWNVVVTFLGIILLVIHFMEYVAVKYNSDKETSFIQTMIFGVLHWLPILRGQ
ncbi:DUF1145 domain-containing protein [Veronia pacifica]|uniref:DUF1145 domain-containing protein n=1 Tax=Veronia pacifica TaxID=1080227 RepID=A0A1C3EPW8_9GAMM|nr:DUF1145 domain-containing protein [Veronia pacifica]ODA35239.1 hypothetical protein A8L45_04825 [Veronia pacifica]